MLRKLLLAAGLALAIAAPVYSADPPKASAPAASSAPKATPPTTQPAATPTPAASGGEPQKFGDEAKATAFCKAGNVVWFNPDSKIYFPSGSQFYGKTKK